MGRQRAEVVGRRAELAALRSALRGRTLVMLRGSRGSGRTAVLARLRSELTGHGVTALEVDGAANLPAWDRFGVSAILSAIRERFEDLGDGGRLIDAMDTLTQLCTEAAYGSSQDRFRLVNALRTVLGRIGTRGAVALIVDDADRLSQPVLALAAARQAGHLVVASCIAGTATGADGQSAELCELADQVVELGPLSGEDSDSVLRQAAGVPVDGSVRQALRESLGSLYGNPGTLVSTVGDLRRRGRLIAVHGQLCLRDPREPIALPAGHWLLGEVDACGAIGRDLVLLAAAGSRAVDFGVDEIPVFADATGRSRIECGRTVDRLVLAGALRADAAGRLSIRHPALGTAVSEDAGDVRRLHRAIAARLLDTGTHGGGRPAVLAGHVAAAGRALSPRSDLVDRLREDELLMPPSDPGRHIAHRYAAWWHAEGEQRSRIAAGLVRLLVRTGDYARLALFTEELAIDDRRPELDSAGKARLAAAAALAALHLGRPVAEPVRAAVTSGGRIAGSAGGGQVPAALEFCDRWFAGAATWLGDVESAFAPLRHSPAVPTIEWRTRHRREAAVNVEHAFAMRDLVPVFESVLGSNYGTVSSYGTVSASRAAVDGPLAAYHRVLAGYAGGDWAVALSAARELELDPHADPFARQCARLHAAEMCNWRGEDRRAAAWLDSVDEQECAFPALRGWVEVGQRHHAGDVAGALRAGWDACERAANRDDPLGLSRLLRRMAAIAMESGEPFQARRAYTEAERWHSRRNSPDALETVLYLRGLINDDGAQARAAERLIRRRGNRFELSMACQLVGATAAEPQSWLHEAFEIAQAIGATRLTARTRRSMAGRGVSEKTRVNAKTTAAKRGRREQLSETERRIIELIRVGRTNRQIALAVRMSEKTVEKHLTRLFAKAGCRTRHGLAMSALGGQPESLGA